MAGPRSGCSARCAGTGSSRRCPSSCSSASRRRSDSSAHPATPPRRTSRSAGSTSTILPASRASSKRRSRSRPCTAVPSARPRSRTDTARRLGEHSLAASDQVTATPVPESPLIKVSAESSSARRAVALATAASGALADYVERQGRSDQDAVILADYRQAERRYRARVAGAEAARAPVRERSDAGEQGRARQASVAVSVALLRRDAVRASYLNLVQGTGSAPAVEEFSRATSATSDRTGCCRSWCSWA